MEVYIAGSISRKCEHIWHRGISEKLLAMGYTTYAPSENKSINDKTNNPTPVDIYKGDVDKLLSCDIFLCEITGSLQDGTIFEVGLMSGLNEQREKKVPMFFYTTNTRLLNNVTSEGFPSASMNHLVLGAFQKHGKYLGDDEDMLKFMQHYYDSRTKEYTK